MYPPELYYCPDCEHVQEPDMLRRIQELMDPSVPGSYQYWLQCGHCPNDDLWDVTFDEIETCLDNALSHVTKLDGVREHAAGFIRHARNMLEYMQ